MRRSTPVCANDHCSMSATNSGSGRGVPSTRSCWCGRTIISPPSCRCAMARSRKSTRGLWVLEGPMSGKLQRIALDVHAHLAPVLLEDLAKIDGVTWQADKSTLLIDGHAVGMKPLFDPPALVAWMDRNAVAKAWISIPPPLYRGHLQGDAAHVWTTYANNGLAGIVAEYPDRLAPLPHLPLQAPGVAVATAQEWIARGHRRFGAPSSSDGDHVLSDEVYEPLWRLLDEAGAFVFF